MGNFWKCLILRYKLYSRNTWISSCPLQDILACLLKSPVNIIWYYSLILVNQLQPGSLHPQRKIKRSTQHHITKDDKCILKEHTAEVFTQTLSSFSFCHLKVWSSDPFPQGNTTKLHFPVSPLLSLTVLKSYSSFYFSTTFLFWTD